MKVFFKLSFLSCLLISHWSKKVTWLGPEYQWKDTTRLHGKGCGYMGDEALGPSYNQSTTVIVIGAPSPSHIIRHLVVFENWLLNFQEFCKPVVKPLIAWNQPIVKVFIPQKLVNHCKSRPYIVSLSAYCCMYLRTFKYCLTQKISKDYVTKLLSVLHQRNNVGIRIRLLFCFVFLIYLLCKQRA